MIELVVAVHANRQVEETKQATVSHIANEEATATRFENLCCKNRQGICQVRHRREIESDAVDYDDIGKAAMRRSRLISCSGGGCVKPPAWIVDLHTICSCAKQLYFRGERWRVITDANLQGLDAGGGQVSASVEHVHRQGIRRLLLRFCSHCFLANVFKQQQASAAPYIKNSNRGRTLHRSAWHDSPA